MRTLQALLFIALAGSLAAEKLSGQEATKHFWSLMDPAVTAYQQSAATDEETGLPVNRYMSKTGGEHLIDIGFSTIEGLFKLKFFYAKKKDVEKSLKAYDSDQMRIQSKAFKEFIRRMVTVDDKEGRLLYFNMIEDIKEAILAMGDGKRMSFVESVVQDTVRLELFYDENLLGIFQVTEVEKSTNNFYLVVHFTISYNQIETTDTVEIPVLTNQKAVFEAQMKAITSKLVLKDYINCNEDNFSQFEKFGKASFGSLITLLPDAQGSTRDLRKFNLKAPDETAVGRIVYIPPKKVNEVGAYEVVIELNGVDMIKKSFKRMSNADFQKFLESLDIKSIFLTLWDKVVRVFENKFTQGFTAQEKKPHFSKSSSSSMFGPTLKKDQAIFDGSNLTMLVFEEKSDYASVTCTTDYPSFTSTNIKFTRKSFNPEVLGQFFDGTIAMLKSAHEKNLAKSSLVKKAI